MTAWKCPCGHSLTWEPPGPAPESGPPCDGRKCVCAQCTGAEITGFTLGHEESYDRYLREKRPRLKVGKCVLDGEPYAGGWLWFSAAAAEAFRRSEGLGEFAVYGLSLPVPWSECAGPRGDDGVHRLLMDAEILGKVPV